MAPRCGGAAREADALGLTLRLVHGLVVPRGNYPGQSVVGADPRHGLLALARRELHEMREEARRTVADLMVDEEILERDPVALLRAHARTASLIVLGSDGFGQLGEHLLARITRGLVGHVDVPVVVVPPDCDATTGDGRAAIVVGDDGTAGSQGAVRLAARRAASRRAPLVIVRAGPGGSLVPDESVLGSDRPPAVRVVVTEERVERVLTDQAHDAQLVVLGVGEHGLLHHRHRTRPAVTRRVGCPVMIVPPGSSSDPVPAGAAEEGTSS